MRQWPRTLEPVSLNPIGRRAFGIREDVALIPARRRARAVIAFLCLMYLAGLAVFSEDVLVALAVLLAGVSTLLESAHGALTFDRVIRRLFRIG